MAQPTRHRKWETRIHVMGVDLLLNSSLTINQSLGSSDKPTIGPQHLRRQNFRPQNNFISSQIFHGHLQSQKSSLASIKCWSTLRLMPIILTCFGMSDSMPKLLALTSKGQQMKRCDLGISGVGLMSPSAPKETGMLQYRTPRIILQRYVYQVDFVVLGLGRFSGIPNIPSFPPGKGPETFHGEVIHSMDYAAMDYKLAAKCIKGKRIVVFGLQKSALDIAMEYSTTNGVELPCTVLYKTERWSVPNYLPWGVPLAYLYLNRFSELLVHKPGEGFLLSSLATILSPLRWVFSKFVESYIKWKLPLARVGMVPKHSFHQEISSCLTSTVPKNFYDRVEEGSILPKKTQNINFMKKA
ncbi:Flavin-dependent monooxygenase 1 [Theobroma cacao]|uniref:Flavin-containing monooxygenase n=1 Tax=Theobroma cacao TaxID=3641 RepID=S1SI82_THECC|nr:Flavin-dependent monooxygenase 1 [Theobroma cacao]